MNKKGDFIPQRDPLTDVYRPVARALNYRSEPFGIDEMHLHPGIIADDAAGQKRAPPAGATVGPQGRRRTDAQD